MNLRTEKQLAEWCIQNAGVNEHIYNAVAEHVRASEIRKAGVGTLLEVIPDSEWGIVRPLTIEQLSFEVGEMVALLVRAEEIESPRSMDRAHGRLVGLFYALGLEAHADSVVRAKAEDIHSLFARLALEHDAATEASGSSAPAPSSPTP